MKFKHCGKCKKLKSLNKFFKDSYTSDGFYSICKLCKLNSSKNWRIKNRKYLKEYYLRYRIENRLKISKRRSEKYYKDHLEKIKIRKHRQKIQKKLGVSSTRHRYGLSLEEYYNLLVTQKRKCKICGKKESHKARKSLSIDHNHKTKEIRGLLCHSCNVVLGLVKENVKVLEQMITYLERN